MPNHSLPLSSKFGGIRDIFSNLGLPKYRHEKIGLLLSRDYKLLSVAAVLEVFETVNKFSAASEQAVPFDIYLLASEETIAQTKEALGYQLTDLKDAPLMQIILIPAFTSDNMQASLMANQKCIPHLVAQYQKGACLGSFCTGAFLLGASGLLNGKIATTHVDASDGFANAFPDVKLKADKTVTQDGRLYTSGGATSSFHLLLHLIHEYCGRKWPFVLQRYLPLIWIGKINHTLALFSLPKIIPMNW